MRFASLGLLVAVLGCSHDHEHESGTSDACSDGGAYERVTVTDEACRAFVEAESRSQVVTDAAKAPAWTSPALGTTKVGAAPPPRFAWTKGTLARASWKKWLRAFDPLPEARAHGDTTGDAYVLIFRDGAGKELHRVLTTNIEYTPVAATWDRIRAGGSVGVTLIGLRYTVNAIASGTKPTAAEPRTFTVE
jgi:hypothetical protein